MLFFASSWYLFVELFCKIGKEKKKKKKKEEGEEKEEQEQEQEQEQDSEDGEGEKISRKEEKENLFLLEILETGCN